MVRYLLILLFSFSFFVLTAQEFIFENLSTKDGLSQNDVNVIFQDQQGFMWFGTNDGLNRYDGYDFTVYRFNADGGDGLNSNLIQTVTQDNDQNIWIGTTGGGVNVMKYLNQEILNVTVPDNQNNLLEKENIIGIDIIENIAVVMTKERVFFLKLKEDCYQSIKVNDTNFIETGSKLSNCYLRVKKNEFIIGTKQGLKFFHFNQKEGQKVSVVSLEESMHVFRIVPFRKGYLLASKNNVVYYVDEHLKFEPLLQEQFNCFLVENDKQVWAGNNSGLHLLTFESGFSNKIVSRNCYTQQSTNGRLGSNSISSIYKDNAGVIWIGTIGGGVSKLKQSPQKFKLFYNNNESRINCFFEDSDGKLWMGSDQGIISYFKSGQYNYTHEANKLNKLKPQTSILAFHEIQIANKTYIIASTDYSIHIQILNMLGKSLTKLPIYKKLKELTHPVIVMVSDEKYLWLGTREGGLYRYNYLTNDLNRFLIRDNATLCSNLINSLCIDSKNNLWIGTDKGLNVLLPKERDNLNPSFEIYTHSKANSGSISHNNIVSILQYNNEIWIGTLGGGLNKYNNNSNTFSRITTSNGLASNTIKGILVDNNNQMWVSSNNGVSSINLTNHKITNFSVSDGLQGHEFLKTASFKRANGELLFGGNKGFNAFYPDQVKIDSVQPNLVFTGLEFVSKANNLNVTYNRAQLANYVADSTHIEFKFNENSFTAYFAALQYTASAKIKYKYRLSGFEEEWTATGSQSRFAKYTNLNPGKYTLEILATNSDGVWLKQALKLSIVITKAWYKSKLAFLVYSLMLIAMFVFFNRYSLIRIKIKNVLLMERFEKEKVEQLSQLKLRFFTNISHELRTPITIIKSYFENIGPNWESLSHEKIKADFNVISRNVDSLNRLVGQLLDFRKLEQNKMTLVPVESDIVTLINSSVSSFNILASNKNIDLIFQPIKPELRFWFDADKMEKIINNILLNAIKYTPNGGRIELRLRDELERVAIEIEDTGIGIPENALANIFDCFYQANTLNNNTQSSGIGLSFVKGLVELHGGKIEVKSTVGKGSIFTLFFKKGSSHFSAIELQTSQVATLKINTDTIQREFQTGTQQTSEYFKNKSLLIVEDNADLQAYLYEQLNAYFKVEVAENGKIALEKIKELAPDLVLSDVMMPQMNGFELCSAIKSNEEISHIPVVLLTAKNNNEAELQGFQLGADAYVVKPFNMEVLKARIVAILNSREQIWKRIKDNPFLSLSEVAFTAKDQQFLKALTSIIDENMSNPDFSVEQLAQLYDISKITLNNKLKGLTGNTSVQYIRLCRLKKAALLLQVEHSRISDVTYDVGYSDLQHFRQHFKNEFSITPSEYKKRYAK